MKFVLAFATDSDTLIRVAYWTGISAIVLTILLLSAVVFMRMASINQHRRRRKITRKWRPILTQAMSGERPESLPRLLRPDRLYFLEFWNYLHESADSRGKEGLNDLATRLGLEDVAFGLADAGTLWKQLLGLQTLGHLGDRRAAEKLRKYVHSDDNVVSLTAARAYMQVDPEAATREILPLIRTREDWAETRVAEILTIAGHERCGEGLCRLFDGATPRQQARLVRLVGATRTPVGHEAVRELLRRYEHDKDHPELSPVIIAGLNILDRPEDRDIVRAYIANPDWHVREVAASALGRIAAPEDEKRLNILLRDEHWWVRYRAAQSLASLPNMTLDTLRDRSAAEENPAAQDILRHVLAERQLA